MCMSVVCANIWSWSKLSFDKCSSIGTSHTRIKFGKDTKWLILEREEVPSTFLYWYVYVWSVLCVWVCIWLVWVLPYCNSAKHISSFLLGVSFFHIWIWILINTEWTIKRFTKLLQISFSLFKLLHKTN